MKITDLLPQHKHLLQTDLAPLADLLKLYKSMDLKQKPNKTEKILLSVICSNLAYYHKEDIKAFCLLAEIKEPIFYSNRNTDSQAFQINLDYFDVISFRGTWELNDIITDSKFIKDTIGDQIKIHRGFLKAVKSISSQVQKTNHQSIITGHSLGGALAQLYAYFNEKETVSNVITFGQPRVGNRKFADDYNKYFENRSLRIINNKDFVSKLPPTHFKFAHTTGELNINRANPRNFKKTLRFSIQDKDKFLDFFQIDHAPKQYFEAIIKEFIQAY